MFPQKIHRDRPANSEIQYFFVHVAMILSRFRKVRLQKVQPHRLEDLTLGCILEYSPKEAQGEDTSEYLPARQATKSNFDLVSVWGRV